MTDRFVLVCGLIARERVSINKAVDDLSPIEKDHMFIGLEEKLDYPANCDRTAQNNSVLSPKPIHMAISNNKEVFCRFCRVKPSESLTTGSRYALSPHEGGTRVQHYITIKVHKINIITNPVFHT
jgi:hypothetical protein